MLAFAPRSWETPFDREKIVTPTPITRTSGGVSTEWLAGLWPSFWGEWSVLFLRRSGDDAGFWAVGDPLMPMLLLSPKHDEFRIRTTCADVLNKGEFARYFFLNGDGKPRQPGEIAAGCAWARGDGTGGWNPQWNHNSGYEWFVPFFHSPDQGAWNFARRDALDVWRELAEARGDGRSDAHFAWHWAHLRARERDDQMWNWPREDALAGTRLLCKLSLEECLKHILLSDETLWQEGDDWVLSVCDPQSITLHPGDAEWEEHEISEAMSDSIALLWERFKPFNIGALSHECVRRWKAHRDVCFQTFAREPSAHERLEAMLKWRDFVEAR